MGYQFAKFFAIVELLSPIIWSYFVRFLARFVSVLGEEFRIAYITGTGRQNNFNIDTIRTGQKLSLLIICCSNCFMVKTHSSITRFLLSSLHAHFSPATYICTTMSYVAIYARGRSVITMK